MPLFVAGAVGLPVLMSAPDGPPAPEHAWLNSQPSAGSVAGPLQPGGPGFLQGNGTWVFPGNEAGPDLSAGPLEFLPIQDLGQVFSFELDPASLRNRFPRISLVTSEQGWQGYRTDLVTGTGTSDLHGCITWYFDANGAMQRISFRGWAGNHQGFRDLLQSRFDLEPVTTGQWTETLVQKNWNGVSSAAIFQLPRVVRQQMPQQQIAALVELNRSTRQSVSTPLLNALQSGSW